MSFALIILTAPLIGAFADVHAAKKRLLLVTTAGCIVFTAGLAAVGRGDIALGVTLIVLSNFCFGTGENLIAAFLPEIADAEALGRVSGWGWSLGYFGGLIALGACSWFMSRGPRAAARTRLSLCRARCSSRRRFLRPPACRRSCFCASVRSRWRVRAQSCAGHSSGSGRRLATRAATGICGAF